MVSNRAPRRVRPLAREPIEVDENQLRDEFWSLARKTLAALDKVIANVPEPPVEWAPRPIPDLPLVMQCWNEAVQETQRPLLTEGPPRLTEGES